MQFSSRLQNMSGFFFAMATPGLNKDEAITGESYHLTLFIKSPLQLYSLIFITLSEGLYRVNGVRFFSTLLKV